MKWNDPKSRPDYLMRQNSVMSVGEAHQTVFWPLSRGKDFCLTDSDLLLAEPERERLWYLWPGLTLNGRGHFCSALPTTIAVFHPAGCQSSSPPLERLMRGGGWGVASSASVLPTFISIFLFQQSALTDPIRPLQGVVSSQFLKFGDTELLMTEDTYEKNLRKYLPVYDYE